MNLSESCCVTGLEIKPGDPIAFLVTETPDDFGSYAFGHFRPTSPVMFGVYLDSPKAVVQTQENSADETLGILAQSMTGYSALGDGVALSRRHMNTDSHLALIHRQTWDFLLTLRNPETGRTIEHRAEDYFAELFEAGKPHIPDEVSGNEGNASDLYRAVYSNIADDRSEGWSCPTYHLDEDPFCESVENAKVVMRAEANLWALSTALWEVRRVLTPCFDATDPHSTYEGVSELARFVRRKGVHAGFVA